MRWRARVPLARRMLLADRRRLLTSVLGVGMALMLILLLDGLWAGVQAQVTTYLDGTGASLVVVAKGTRNLAGEGSQIPAATLDQVRAVPGVQWAAKARSMFVILDLHGKKVPVTVVGYDVGARGGPWRLAAGRDVSADDEVVLDQAVAKRHGLTTGSQIMVSGQPFRVVGLSRGTGSFMVGLLFMTHQAADQLIRAPGTTSYVLVGTADPDATRRALQDRGFTVLSAAEVAANDRALLTKIYGVPVRLMVVIAFLAGTLIIALTAYTAIVERRREYGVVKALGATSVRLAQTAIGQTLGIAFGGLLAGAVLSLGGRWLLALVRPQFPVVYSAESAGRVAAAAVLMGVIAGLASVWRLKRLDPASAYQGG